MTPEEREAFLSRPHTAVVTFELGEGRTMGVPVWVTWVADIFPLKHFSLAFGHAFRSDMAGSGFLWSGPEETYIALPRIAIMLAWGIFGAAVAAKLFKWDPKGEI